MRWDLAVAGLAIIFLLADLFVPKISKQKLGWAAAGSLGFFLLLSLLGKNGLPTHAFHMETAHGFYLLDRLAIWIKQFSMLATLLTILMSLRFWNQDEDHLGEYIFLQLIACLAMMLISSVTDFFSLFVSLELMTLCFYILVSFQRKNTLCLEAGLKYLIYGALSSGILLYGITLIYGASNEIQFKAIAKYAASHRESTLLLTGLLLTLVGIGFKISAVPFQWWTPDVYEGAPAPTVALLSMGSKAAGFVLLIRILIETFPAFRRDWFPLICVASGASILVGNLGALTQNNLKRLMGYSSISHTGYMLLGIAAWNTDLSMGLSAILYYLLGYLLANALVFGVICETSSENPRQEIRAYAGLGTRSSWNAAALTLGFLSLAGIPPLAGFFGKFLLFSTALNQNLILLLALAVIGVICSLYYYLSVIRTIYFSKTSEVYQPLITARSTRWIFGLLMILIIFVGFYQAPWWQSSVMAIRALQP